MSHFRNDNLRFAQVEYALPSTYPFQPWIGTVAELPNYAVPNDLPSPLLDSCVDQFTLQPEQALTHFLEANPSFSNPPDIGRLLFHTARLSPYATSVILFNSIYSSRALTFSFMTAIDLDCLSFVEAVRYVAQKAAIPTQVSGSPLTAFSQYVSTFASAFSMRNPLEWPDPIVVKDLLTAAICSVAMGRDFTEQARKFPSLKSVSSYLIGVIGQELSQSPPPFYFTSAPIRHNSKQELSGEIDHDGGVLSSWQTFRYKKEETELQCFESKTKGKFLMKLPLDKVVARARAGVAKKPWCLTLQRTDGLPFVEKPLKDGTFKMSSSNTHLLAFKTEYDMFVWMSAINQRGFLVELAAIN
jgi:hypothetical protein